MLSLLRLCRPYYCVPMGLTYTLTIYYAAGGDLAGRWPAAAATTGALMLVIAGAYALNDAFDVAVDRVNAPHRPVAAGRVKRRTAAIAAALLMTAGLALAVAGRWTFLAALAAVATGLAVYDATSKRLGALKPVAAAALMTCIYPLAVAQAGGAVGPRRWSLAFFAAWMFLTSFGYEVLKDIRDAAGDPAVVGRLGFARHRPRRWRTGANVAILVGAALLVGPAATGCKWLYVAIVPAALAAAVVAVRQPTRRAIRSVYLECVLVGVAATVDVAVLGT